MIGSTVTQDVIVEEQFETIAREVSPTRLALRRFLRHRLAVISMVVLVLMILAAIFAPLIAPYNPTAQDANNTLIGPSPSHWLGTDDLGRDILSRLIYGGRVTLGIGFGATAVVLIIGILVGAVAGYAGGWLDNVLMRFVDLVLSFPSLFLLLILAADAGVTLLSIILFIGLFGWMYLARLVRGEFLVLREMEYIEAARAVGVGGWRTVYRHMLPNTIASIIVNATFSIAGAMYIEAALDFLGFGLSPEIPTWGSMLAASENYIAVNPLLTIAPGLLLTIAILAVNFIGDGLRDAFDPRSK
ncbi:MAG: ABC transporter permease [Chloroflexota bacterium]|nr:ABC transporter permease [Chloroflexota bacterium]